jgi:hypothetical protein
VSALGFDGDCLHEASARALLEKQAKGRKPNTIAQSRIGPQPVEQIEGGKLVPTAKLIFWRCSVTLQLETVGH